MESMNHVKEIVNSRLESMPLKDEKISFQQSATSENLSESIHLIDRTVDITPLTSLDLKKYGDL